MDSYLKIEMPAMELYAYLGAIEESFEHPGKVVKMPKSSVTFTDKGNPDKDMVTFKLSADFVGYLSEIVFNAVKDKGMTQKGVMSKFTFVDKKE